MCASDRIAKEEQNDSTDGRMTFSTICAIIKSGRRVSLDRCKKYRSFHSSMPQGKTLDTEAVGRRTWRIGPGSFKMGDGSFPQLKIPHHNPACFCSIDTARGLDNKKRRYAPRRGVAYRLFLWGFPKGATPPFGTRLCLQSVVCYTLCRRCCKNEVAIGKGKHI